MPSHHEALKNTLESKGLRFHIKAGNAKWECTLLDRAAHERRKTERTDSSSSVTSTASSSSSSSSASTRSQ